MIGMPTDFKHTGHIGSGDMASGSDLGSIQGQMQSKGGYQGISVPLACTPAGIPVGGGNWFIKFCRKGNSTIYFVESTCNLLEE